MRTCSGVGEAGGSRKRAMRQRPEQAVAVGEAVTSKGGVPPLEGVFPFRGLPANSGQPPRPAGSCSWAPRRQPHDQPQLRAPGRIGGAVRRGSQHDSSDPHVNAVRARHPQVAQWLQKEVREAVY